MITFQPSMCHTTFYMLLKTKQNKTKKKKVWIIKGTRDFAMNVVWWSSESSAGGRREGKEMKRTFSIIVDWEPRSEAVRKTRDLFERNLFDTKKKGKKEKNRKKYREISGQRENKEKCCARAELRPAISFVKIECSLRDEALPPRFVVSNFHKTSTRKRGRLFF